jgi:Flp pilus assembly pilin Flp
MAGSTNVTRIQEYGSATMIREFIADETGAVTVDWVVLAAGVVGLCIVALGAIESATLGLANATATATAATGAAPSE